jgi:hypothetical protein
MVSTLEDTPIMTLHSLRPAALGFTALALLALGADEAKQTVEVEGLKFDAPAAWKKGKPTSAMRKAQLAVAPAAGDKDSAELVVFVFPGRAGTVQQNVERWQKQFKDKDDKTPDVESKTVKGKNTDVTRVEVAGTYTDPFGRPPTPKPDHRLLAAIVETKDAAYFLRMVGPDKTMKDAEPAFDELIKSIQVGD